MANIIRPKRSSTAAKVPTTTDLSSGEFGVNMVDQKCYINNGTTIVQVGAGKLSALGDVTLTSIATGQVLSWNGSAFVNTATTGASSVVLRDANQNILANNLSYGTTSITSAGTTTTLTAANGYFILITGTLTQTVKFPDETTLPAGTAYIIDNDSTGVVTLQDSAGGALGTVPAGMAGYIYSKSNATATGNWAGYAYVAGQGPTGQVTWGTAGLNMGGGTISGLGQLTSAVTTGTAPFVVASTTQVANLNAATAGTAGNVTGVVALANGGTGKTTATESLASLFGFTTTATAAGSTTLTATSSYNQVFTGTLAQTIVLPVATTLSQGWSVLITNASTGILTVNSSGANAVILIPANSTALVACVLNSGTSAASWVAGLTSLSAATTTQSGYLTSTDWTTFNGKITLSSAITGYTAGTNTALAATDTLLAALGKIQGQITARSGTVSSVGFTGGLITVATATTTPALTVAGTSGGIPYFSSASTWASSGVLSASSLVVGGGAGVAPSTITTGTGVVTALGVAIGTTGSMLTNGGAIKAAISTKTAAYTATATDYTILANATTAAFSVTLPASVAGQIYIIKKIDSSVNAVTVATTTSQTIDGVTTRVLPNQYDSLTVIGDGTNWYQINATSRSVFVGQTFKIKRFIIHLIF